MSETEAKRKSPRKTTKSTTRKSKRKTKTASTAVTAPASRSLGPILQCGKKSPYLWSLPANLINTATSDRITGWFQASSGRGKLTTEQLDDIRQWAESASEIHALEVIHCLQAVWLLPKIDKQDETLSAKIKERCQNTVSLSKSDSPQQVWIEMLAGIELALTLSVAIPEASATKATIKSMGNRISVLLDDFCDTDGVPHAEHLTFLRPILATWVRSIELSKSLGVELLKKKSQGLFDAVVEQCLRFTCCDKTSLGTEAGPFAFSKRMFQLALSNTDNKDLQMLASGSLGLGGKLRASMLDGLESASTHTEWGSLALLRSHWSGHSPKLMIDFSKENLGCHLDSIAPVLQGVWEVRVDRDGKPLRQVEPWSVVCWHDDDDGTYIELETRLEQETKFQRQIFLGSEDTILFIGDAVFHNQACSWDYRSELPLASGVELSSADESREGHLVRHESNGALSTLGLVIPLQLPEWRTDKVDAGMDQSGRQLVHYGHLDSQRGYFPLFIDLNPVRAQSALTWRRLTVGEGLEICPPDVAVGYRAQVGHEQWIFYRSLSHTGNRTFLGQNLFADFYAGQFDADGQAAELITINEEDN